LRRHPRRIRGQLHHQTQRFRHEVHARGDCGRSLAAGRVRGAEEVAVRAGRNADRKWMAWVPCSRLCVSMDLQGTMATQRPWPWHPNSALCAAAQNLHSPRGLSFERRIMAMFQSILVGLGGAFAVAAVALVLGGLIRWRSKQDAWLSAAAALGIGAAFVVGYAAVLGLPSFPPAEALHRLG